MKKDVETTKHTSSKMLISVLHVNIGVCDFKSFRHCAYTDRNNDSCETSLSNDFVKSTTNVERKTWKFILLENHVNFWRSRKKLK